MIIIIITILGLIIYDNLHYSKREILKIINRVGEDFSNVHITIERYDFISKYISVNEIYGKDNVIYDYTYSNYSVMCPVSLPFIASLTSIYS